jgi:hypothetical protein
MKTHPTLNWRNLRSNDNADHLLFGPFLAFGIFQMPKPTIYTYHILKDPYSVMVLSRANQMNLINSTDYQHDLFMPINEPLNANSRTAMPGILPVLPNIVPTYMRGNNMSCWCTAQRRSLSRGLA